METVFPSFLSAVDRLSWFLLALFTSWIVLGSADKKQTSWPLHSKKPVLFIWNAETQHCETNHSVKLSLGQFDIVSIPGKDMYGQNFTMFHKENLGIYPYYNNKEEAVNGGLAQSANLSQHLEKMSKDIDIYIPDRKAKGLIVVDFRDWYPTWLGNHDYNSLYLEKSRDLVKKKNPKWTPKQVETAAKEEFERSAREFMLETLRLGRKLRPNKLWGYYDFPGCFNYDYFSEYHLDTYAGRCQAFKIEHNDQLNWMWHESNALFPTIYPPAALSSKDQGRLYVLNRVKEAMRIAPFGDGLARPVFPCARPTFRDTTAIVTEKELVHTIGESVALGAAGVIFGGTSIYATSTGCKDLSNHLQGDLGRYLLNVTTAAKECSQKLCNFNGRCLRREPDSTVYLHLRPSTHRIISQSGKLKVTGSPGKAELKAFRQHFKCQCYNGTKGENCKLGGKGGRDEKEIDLCNATSVSGMLPLCFVLQLGLLSLFH